MRIVFGLAGLAACSLAPHAFAQSLPGSSPASAPILAATLIQPGIAAPARMRNREASSMADFYPFESNGFHLSAGLRFFEARSMLRQNAKAMRDLVYLPRSVGNAGVRWGYRRVASMAVGYTQPLDQDVSVGLEVGAMMGHAISTVGRLGPRAGGDGRRESGPNSIVHLLVNVSF